MIKLNFQILLFIFSFSFSYSQGVWGEPQNLNSLNTSGDEFAPSWNKFENNLYFNSTRTGYSNFYTAKYSSGSFSFQAPVKGEMNRKRNNQSYIIFPEENLAYVSTFKMNEERSYLNLHFSRKKKDEWTKPFILDSLSGPFFASQPAISPDGSFMIFSTSKNSKYKDTDLWGAWKQENGTWGALYELDELNSPGNEITPFLSSSDTLYFASDGQEGPGGFDIFVSIFREGRWQRPRPLFELNTESNESDFIIIPTGEALFSSDRPGGTGALDLYSSRAANQALPQIAVKPEIRLEPQAKNLSAKNLVHYKWMPLSAYILSAAPTIIDKEIKPQISTLYQDINIDSLPMNWNVDSIYYYTPQIIAERILSNPEAALELITFGEIKQEHLKKVREYFLNKWNIPSSRIKVVSQKERKELSNQSNESFILMNSNLSQIFEPVKLKANETDISPAEINFYLDAAPQGIIKEWDAYMYLNGRLIDHIDKGSAIPSTIKFDTKSRRNEIYNADSLSILLIAKDADGKEYREVTSVSITHTETSQPFFTLINKMWYEVYPLILLDQSHLTLKAPFERTLNMIAESFKPVNYAIIDYPNRSLQNAASAVEAYLKKLTSGRTGLNNTGADEGTIQSRSIIIKALKPELN